MPTLQPYLLHIVPDNTSFRLPELFSCAQLYGFELRVISTDITRPFLIVEVDGDESAKRIAERCILVKSVSRLFGMGDNYPQLIEQVRSHPELWTQYEHTSFAFEVDAINYKMRKSRVSPLIESFSFMNLQGLVTMKNPEIRFMIHEEYDLVQGREAQLLDAVGRDGKFRCVYMSLLVAYGAARHLIAKFTVRERSFYGNTSMEAEMSLLMANQALAAPGKLVYDPFTGTGSLLYTAMHWGAYAIGSDIDGRQMRGKDPSGPGVYRAASQYNVRDQLLDCATFDVTLNPWRRGGILDAIVTDPPWMMMGCHADGVRAGAKRLGRRDERVKEEPTLMPDGKLAHQLPGYIPPTRPYEMAQLCYDLVLFARYMLVPGGRLVFFLPTFQEEFEDVDVPVVEGMREIKYGTGSCQDFNKWARRLITMEKSTTDEYPPPSFEPMDFSTGLPAHTNFGVKFREMGALTPGALTPSAIAEPRTTST